MVILIDILLLFIVEAFACCLSEALDYFGKQRNYDKAIRKKINVLFLKSNYEKRNYISVKVRPVSKSSFVFQIINFVYAVTYMVIAIIDTFVYYTDALFYIQYISLAVYGGIVIVMVAIMAFFLSSRNQ